VRSKWAADAWTRTLRLPVFYGFDRVVRRQDRMREKRVINERRLIAVAPFGVPGRSGRIFRDGYLEPLFKQFAQVRFTHMLASIPPRMTLLILRLRSCKTRSLVPGPHTRCGATTMVLPSSM